MIIATHSGKFHADDVWGVSVLDVLYPDCELIRTRDMERINAAAFAVDVGGEWNPSTGRFDHHQKGFDGARLSGVVYASAGLVWKEYGAPCVAKLARMHAGHRLTDDQAQQMAHAIDHDIVQYLDMSDTGAAKNAPGGYGLSAVISGFNPGWIDEQQAGSTKAIEECRLQRFRTAMAFMKDIIANAVKYRVGGLLAVEEVRSSELLEGGKILFLKNGAMPWASVVRNEMPNVLFVISNNISEQRYMLHTVSATPESFASRKDLPAAWAGLQGAELAAVTNVPDALFCHNGRFIASAKSFDGATALARLALAETS